MAEPTLPQKGILVAGIMSNNSLTLKSALDNLEAKFGKFGSKSNEYDFNFTDYYNEEMGKDYRKFFISFSKRVSIEKLPIIKLWTNDLERIQEKRLINIDPGYLTEEKLVVASCKPRPHRIYLSKGVYAHLMFFFKRNGVIPFKWTFEDYLLDSNVKFFLDCRKTLLKR